MLFRLSSASKVFADFGLPFQPSITQWGNNIAPRDSATISSILYGESKEGKICI
jgi:hypothetical protein